MHGLSLHISPVAMTALTNLKLNLSSKPSSSPTFNSSRTDQLLPNSFTPLLFTFLTSHLLSFLKFSILAWLIHILWRLFANWFRGVMVRRLTAMDDLDSLTRSRKEGEKIKGTAIIAGGSIAGLLAARVCANHFDKVLVVEPEAWTFTKHEHSTEELGSTGTATANPAQPNRSRVPQYTALHGYQAFCYLLLARMFPSFDEHALQLSPSAVGPCDYNIYMGGRLLRAPLEAYGGVGYLPKFVSLTRPAFECLIRRLMKAACGETVEFEAGSVSGIVVNPDEKIGSKCMERMGQIKGAIIRSKKGEETFREAALVVDCTGPTCAGIKWLSHAQAFDTSADVPKPKPIHVRKQVYDPKMRYTTVTYHVNPRAMKKLTTLPCVGGWEKAGALYTYLPDARMDRRTLLVMKREGELLQFACGGFDLADRPRSIDDVRTFVSSLNGLDPVPSFLYDILDTVQEMEDAGWDLDARYSDVRIPPCHKVHYEDVKERLPSNFIAIGDSVTRVNPVRGQGCTKATVGVATLSGLLDKLVPYSSAPSVSSTTPTLPPTFSKSFWTLQTSRIGGVWDQTKAEDYAWETTSTVEGESLEDGKWTRWYTRNLIAVGRENDTVANAIYGSAMFLAPGTDALHPSIVVRVIWAGLKEYLGWTKLAVQVRV